MVTALEQFWQYILAGVAGVAWLLRLEAKTDAAHRRMDNLEAQRHEDLKAAATSRGEMIDMMHEMRGDIKTLLRGNVK